MKKIITAILVMCMINSCTKKGASRPYKPTGFSVVVKKNSKLSTGQVIENDINSVILVWRADGKDFDVTKISDLLGGYAYDKNTGTSYKDDYGEINIMSKTATPGRYFVYVQLTNNGGSFGDLAYSYTYFDVTDANQNMLKKAFTTHALTAQYESWNEVE